MKNRLTFAISILIMAALACKISPIDDVNLSTQIISLAVVPPAGSSNFVLEVAYKAHYSTRENPPTIFCNYVAPDSATMSIGRIVPMRPSIILSNWSWINENDKLPFSVTQANGVTQPGTYVAGCSTGFGSMVTTTFTVTGNATAVPTTPTSTPAAMVSPTPTAFQVTVSGKGRQIIIYSQPTTATCTVPAELSLTVNADGTAEISITTSSLDSISNYNNLYNGIYDCFWRPGSNTFALPGKSELTTQTVKFNQSGNIMLCDGSFSYAGETLSGEMLCGNYRDIKFIMP